ncbi:MAG: VWA domain-containing protein [Bryobacteraceae bacterium]
MTHALLRAASPLLATLLLAAQPVIRVGVPLIVAPTSVTDRSGNFINGLSAADFQLYDNDVPQLIHEDGDFLPISVAIAIQSNLNKHAVERVHELGPLLGALVVGVGGEAAIFTFNHQLDVRQDFTPDLGRLTHALRRIEFSPGPSHVIDATLDAMRLLDQRPELRRRILMLISESRDTPTNPGSQTTLEDALSEVPMSNTLIYWLNIGRGAGAEDPMPTMTRYTGGRQYSIGSEHALERAITQIGEEIHGQYLLSYTPAHTPATVDDTGFHRIRVVAKRAGFEVRSRPGYWPSH